MHSTIPIYAYMHCLSPTLSMAKHEQNQVYGLLPFYPLPRWHLSYANAMKAVWVAFVALNRNPKRISVNLSCWWLWMMQNDDDDDNDNDGSNDDDDVNDDANNGNDNVLLTCGYRRN